MLAEIEVFWVRSEVVAGLEVGEIALDVAGGAAAARGGEADVGRHRCQDRLTVKLSIILKRKRSPSIILSE